MTPCTYRTKMAERLHCSNTRLRGFPLDLVTVKTCERCIWKDGVETRRPVPAWFTIGKVLIIVRWQQLFAFGSMLKKMFRAIGIKPCTPCGERAKKLDALGAKLTTLGKSSADGTMDTINR